MRRILSIVLIILLACSGFVLHPINMSVGDIRYEEGKMYLKFKFFADDFQSTLSDYYKVPVDILSGPMDKKSEKYIREYIAAKFNMWVNGTAICWEFKKVSSGNEVIYVEYEYPLKDLLLVKTVRIRNILQFEAFPEQKNIINIRFFETLRVLRFDNGGEDTQEVEF